MKKHTNTIRYVDQVFLNKDGEKSDEVLQANEETEKFTVGLLNIKQLTEIKWMNILEYMRDTRTFQATRSEDLS